MIEPLALFSWIVLICLGLLAVLLMFSILHHTCRLRQERNKYPPPGKIIQMYNRKMHIYASGQGDIPLVFMAGHATSSPTLDFKPLWMRMTDQYRIVVVERAGYGWSETSRSPGDIDTLLEETRNALYQSGEKGPYVLIPHSMSGLEAIYWSQKYPDEVVSIIGLDPAVPEVYETAPELFAQNRRLQVMYIVSRIGLTRFMGRKELEKHLPLIRSKELSREDIDCAVAIFHKGSFTRNMWYELRSIPANARKVKSHPVPVHIPMYFFLSDGQELIFPDWEEQLTKYVSSIHLGRYKILGSGHYMHHEKSALIADEVKGFLGEILDT